MNSFLNQLGHITGAAHVLTGTDAAPYFHEYGGLLQGHGLCVVRPSNAEQVAAIVKLCAQHGVKIVPQGGNTGLVGGSVPYDDNAIVLNLARMKAIRAVDRDNFSMVVEAGCVLSVIQDAAHEAGLYFPLRLGSQGSCQIGGNIAANAGGILTLRYGNCRDLVLGLEVVLPDGEIWHGLRALRKDNTGYDLKHLFIGSEGTLGIITAAVLKLFPAPGLRETFFAATDNLESVIALLSVMKTHFGDRLSGFEIISAYAMDCVFRYNASCVLPLRNHAPWSLLVEIACGKDNTALRQQIEDVLAAAFQDGLLTDAVIAQNEEQRKAFWAIREIVSDAAQSCQGGSIKHDVSVPIFKIPGFVRDAVAAAEKVIPGTRPAIFGHAGDGNLHFDLTIPVNMTVEDFHARWKEVTHAVHDVAQAYGGSFAAEHGVGIFKAQELTQRKSAVELDLMRAVKTALDPQAIMNPGVILLQ